MGKFKPDLTDPVASAKGWTRRQRRANELEQLREKVKELEADVRFYRDGDVQDSTDPVMLRERVKELEEDVACLESMMHRQDMANLRSTLFRRARQGGGEQR